ncbi:MAG: Ig-like domain-containing protein, partial [Deltaproteobacteria bacterium]
AVTAEKATNHLARSLHYKNQTNFQVLFKLPDEGEDNVSTSSLIAIAFNKPLRKGDLAATLTLDGTDLPVHAVEGNWLLFQPTLTAGTSYQASLNSAVSFTGETLESPISWSFTTGSSPERPFPNLIQLSPDNGTSNNPTDAVPTITFNGPVFPVSGTIQFTLDNGSSVPCSPIIQGVSVSCIPKAPLNADNYTATLAAGTLKSIEGVTNNQLSWQFTTGSSTSSGGASLRHLGEFNDNVTDGSVVMLHVGNGGKQYQLEVNGSATDWQYPIFYPVQVPLQLAETEGTQIVSVHYRDDKTTTTGTYGDNVTITLDKTPPVAFLTLPHQTNQSSLPYLVMANDNLSDAWRYFVNDCSVQPEKDFESWVNFPNPAITSSVWDNVTATNAGLNCVSQADLQNFSDGNSHFLNFDCSATTTSATKSDFENYLPAWDNQTLDLSLLSAGDNQTRCLWVMDKAGNMRGTQQTVTLDNAPPDNSSNVANLSISPTPNTTDNFTVSFNTTDSDTFAFLFQIDNSTGPSANQLGWIPLSSQQLTFVSSQQSQTIYTWIKDQAGNIASLSPIKLIRAHLYDGNIRVDNQTNPTVHRYANLRLKYPVILPTVNLPIIPLTSNPAPGIWHQDNDSLQFWMQYPLASSTNYSINQSGFEDNST